MVGRVSYLGRVKQGNYHTHALYTIPNPNYTFPKPYPFIITYPIHHPTLGTQTGRVLPCASIDTTLPWIPTYPYPSIVIPYPSTYPTLPTVGKIPVPTLSIYPTYPILVTSAYIPVPTSHLTIPFITYPTLHFPILYYCQGLIKYKAETIYQIRPKLPRTETTQAETTQGRNDSGLKRKTREAVAVVEQERTCRVVHLIIWLSILFGCEYSGLLIFVIIVFPYTHDTGAVTGTESGVEFYTLALIEINIAAFLTFFWSGNPKHTYFCFYLALLNMRNTLKKWLNWPMPNYPKNRPVYLTRTSLRHWKM